MAEKNKRKLPQDIYDEAVRILLQSELLKETVIWQDKQVQKYVQENPESKIDLMSWEEKEACLKKADELWARLNQSVRELKILNDAYEKLREKVKLKYGKDMMPPAPPFITPGLEDTDIDMGEGS